MKGKRYTEEQISYALRQAFVAATAGAEAAVTVPIAAACLRKYRRVGIYIPSPCTSVCWKRYAAWHLGS